MEKFQLTIYDFPLAIPSRKSFGARAEIQRVIAKTLAIFTRRTTAWVKSSWVKERTNKNTKYHLRVC